MMVKLTNGNGAVSIQTFIAAVVLILSVLGFLITRGEQSTAGMVSRGEFEMVCKRLDRMEMKIDRLLERKAE